MDNSKVLIEEIKQITIQYRAEVGSQRKPWPNSIKVRVEKLYAAGMKLPQIAKLTGVPYFSILHWRSREKKKFHQIGVKAIAVPELEAATVTVAALQMLKSAEQKPATASQIATVTVTTPDGFQIKIDGIDQGLEILRRLRGSICS
jgi:hypothetical protein